MDIFKEYGTDSYAGLVTSLALSSTETIFYTMSVYYMAIGITKTRWTLAGGISGNSSRSDNEYAAGWMYVNYGKVW